MAKLGEVQARWAKEEADGKREYAVNRKGNVTKVVRRMVINRNDFGWTVVRTFSKADTAALVRRLDEQLRQQGFARVA
jgi:hypothetical protein